jgi:hypothetical protein
MLPTTKLDFSLEFRSPITRRQRTGTNGFFGTPPAFFPHETEAQANTGWLKRPNQLYACGLRWISR